MSLHKESVPVIDENNQQNQAERPAATYRDSAAAMSGAVAGALLGALLGAPDPPFVPDRMILFLVVGLFVGSLAGLLAVRTSKKMKLVDRRHTSFWVRAAGHGGAFTLAVLALFFGAGLVDIVSYFIVGALFGAVIGLFVSLVAGIFGFKSQ